MDTVNAITKETVKSAIVSLMVARPNQKVTFAELFGYVADHFGVDKNDNARFQYFVNDCLMELKNLVKK